MSKREVTVTFDECIPKSIAEFDPEARPPLVSRSSPSSTTAHSVSPSPSPSTAPPPRGASGSVEVKRTSPPAASGSVEVMRTSPPPASVSPSPSPSTAPVLARSIGAIRPSPLDIAPHAHAGRRGTVAHVLPNGGEGRGGLARKPPLLNVPNKGTTSGFVIDDAVAARPGLAGGRGSGAAPPASSLRAHPVPCTPPGRTGPRPGFLSPAPLPSPFATGLPTPTTAFRVAFPRTPSSTPRTPSSSTPRSLVGSLDEASAPPSKPRKASKPSFDVVARRASDRETMIRTMVSPEDFYAALMREALAQTKVLSAEMKTIVAKRQSHPAKLTAWHHRDPRVILQRSLLQAHVDAERRFSEWKAVMSSADAQLQTTMNELQARKRKREAKSSRKRTRAPRVIMTPRLSARPPQEIPSRTTAPPPHRCIRTPARRHPAMLRAALEASAYSRPPQHTARRRVRAPPAQRRRVEEPLDDDASVSSASTEVTSSSSYYSTTDSSSEDTADEAYAKRSDRHNKRCQRHGFGHYLTLLRSIRPNVDIQRPPPTTPSGAAPPSSADPSSGPGAVPPLVPPSAQTPAPPRKKRWKAAKSFVMGDPSFPGAAITVESAQSAARRARRTAWTRATHEPEESPPATAGATRTSPPTATLSRQQDSGAAARERVRTPATFNKRTLLPRAGGGRGGRAELVGAGGESMLCFVAREPLSFSLPAG